MLGGELAVLQPPMFDGLPLDPFSLFDDGCSPAEVGVRGRHVAQRFVVTPVIVVFDERLDLGLKIAGQEVVFQQDAVFRGLVPALDLALRLGMERRTAHVAHALGRCLRPVRPRYSRVHYPTAGVACAERMLGRSPTPPAPGPAYRSHPRRAWSCRASSWTPAKPLAFEAMI